MQRYVISYSLKNGLGNPSVDLYLTGCDKPVKCEDCHNWEIQEESKEDYNIDVIKEELKVAIKQSQIFSSKLYLTVLGGEPLAKYNRDITEQIAEYVKNEFPEVTLVLYTWREIDEIDNFDYAVIGGYDKEIGRAHV